MYRTRGWPHSDLTVTATQSKEACRLDDKSLGAAYLSAVHATVTVRLYTCNGHRYLARATHTGIEDERTVPAATQLPS